MAVSHLAGRLRRSTAHPSLANCHRPASQDAHALTLYTSPSGGPSVSAHRVNPRIVSVSWGVTRGSVGVQRVSPAAASGMGFGDGCDPTWAKWVRKMTSFCSVSEVDDSTNVWGYVCFDFDKAGTDADSRSAVGA